jgi:hypothetical protein
VAGNEFSVDRDGVHATGAPASVPGLPDDPGEALQALGVSFELPKGARSTKGADGKAALQGLQIVIDTKTLHSKLDSIPFDTIVNAIPDQAGQLKSLAGAAVHAAPKIVITTGNASTEANTVASIKLPGVAGVLPSATGGAGSSTGGNGISSTGIGSTGALPGTGTAGSAVPSDAGTGANVTTANAAAGLPPLASVPGALLVGGLILASGVGWWLQRIGGFVVGGAGSCAHGLETGVPDLRKA